MRGSVGAACPFSPPAGRRCRQADEGRVTASPMPMLAHMSLIPRTHPQASPLLDTDAATPE
ncbi:hypothetical protein CN135_22055 [Sinorhizobium meliloti]|nr:hypothetical protein CN230_08710 [Sinorhizobium meliloti]RVG30394.1 hypothetical protein CN229_12320 [Sinorhizobium meliloti]RVG35701.1 hypothetical protein CN225_13300 [Sinorhizobium meliloti]RVG61328.1 hypothetical protein CN224_09680 [Sinorhizobium meliloti]RVI63960.1 hypothetical protein CN191_33255 [Sinorhizobium meliloti]